MIVQCKAKAKSTGERCKRPAVEGREVCRLHGGLTPRGIASPHWKHGGYSRYPVPGKLAERYERSVADPEILNLTQEIALVDSRTTELLETLGTGESGSIWRQVGKRYAELVEAYTGGNKEEIGANIESLGDLLAAGSHDFELWADIIGLVDQRRRLVESEQKRRTAMQTSINIEDMAGIVNALVGIIKRNVADPKALNRISAELQNLMHANTITSND